VEQEESSTTCAATGRTLRRINPYSFHIVNHIPVLSRCPAKPNRF
jgi:hypothetical protein